MHSHIFIYIYIYMPDGHGDLTVVGFSSSHACRQIRTITPTTPHVETKGETSLFETVVGHTGLHALL